MAGSWFATVTSAAMGGYGVPVVAAVGQGIGAGAALVGGAYATKELRKEKEGEEADEAKDEGGELPPNDPKNDDDDGVGTEKEKASRWRQSGLGRRDFDDESTLLDDSDSENSNEDWHP